MASRAHSASVHHTTPLPAPPGSVLPGNPLTGDGQTIASPLTGQGQRRGGRSEPWELSPKSGPDIAAGSLHSPHRLVLGHADPSFGPAASACHQEGRRSHRRALQLGKSEGQIKCSVVTRPSLASRSWGSDCNSAHSTPDSSKTNDTGLVCPLRQGLGTTLTPTAHLPHPEALKTWPGGPVPSKPPPPSLPLT